MKPDYQKAAILATETLIKNGINSSPVDPLPILKRTPGVLVVSYEKMSEDMGMDRQCMISMFGRDNQDAFTSVNLIDGKPQYLVTYNQKLSFHICQRALARELAHIVMGHDGSLPEDVRLEEARCFANHLLAPRALIHTVQATGLRLTVDVVGNLTGCYDYCLSCIRKLPAVSVPRELNKTVRDNFMPYIMNYFELQRVATHTDGSALADLGTYMDGYEE